MNKEMMIEVDLIGNGVDCRVEVPASIFFQLVPIISDMVEIIGLKNAGIEYASMLEDIREKSKQMGSASWFSVDTDTQIFIRKCQMVAILGAQMYDHPLMICGDGVTEHLEYEGGINITEEVETGEILWHDSGDFDLFRQRCL